MVVDGLTFRNSNRAGLGIIRSDHITVRNCVFANNYKWGIFTGFADDVLFENNECYGAKDEHGIYHSPSGDRAVIVAGVPIDEPGTTNTIKADVL